VETAIPARRTTAAATASAVRRLSWPGNAAMTGTSRRTLNRRFRRAAGPGRDVPGAARPRNLLRQHGIAPPDQVEPGPGPTASTTTRW
jgi:hypothetical protein